MKPRGAVSFLALAALIAAPLVLGLASLLFLRRGTADRVDGIPAVARVEQASAGSCLLGASGEACRRLSLTVLPSNEAPFKKQLDVRVPEQHASRIQPGAYLWVVQNRVDPKDVLLAVDALDEPAPEPPAASQVLK